MYATDLRESRSQLGRAWFVVLLVVVGAAAWGLSCWGLQRSSAGDASQLTFLLELCIFLSASVALLVALERLAAWFSAVANSPASRLRSAIRASFLQPGLITLELLLWMAAMSEVPAP